MVREFVIYKRVSTREQSDSGLGLEAQQAGAEHYIDSLPNGLILDSICLLYTSPSPRDRG